MKLPSLFVACCALIFTGPFPGTALAQNAPAQHSRAQPSDDELRTVIEEYVEKRSFAGTVLIARQGEVIVEEAYGNANEEWGVRNSINARYRIGSLSKPFLATLVMKLAEKGELSLDDTLGQHLPELYRGTDAAPVTITQLLSHTSGLGDLPGNLNDPWYQTTARLAFEPEKLAQDWIKPELKETPGSKWRYNNAGFILLGMIVEAATGQSYSNNLQQHLFGPARMTNSGVFTQDAVLPRLANGYAKGPDGNLVQPIRIDASVFFSAAGIYSSAHDILRFDMALYDPEFIGSDARLQMHTKQTEFPYGLGWGVEEWPLGDDRKLSVTHHTGSIPGYQSFYIRSEENQDAVIVLNNTNNGSAVIEMGRNLMIMLNNGVKPKVLRRLKEHLSPIAHIGGTKALSAAIMELGDDLNAGQLAEYDAREGRLNRLGYDYLGAEKVSDAIAIFEWTTRLYPQSANAFDSLGEALRAIGNIDASIKSYERALELDPDSQSSAQALKELRGN